MSTQVSYIFDRSPAPVQSEFKQLAAVAREVVQAMPLAVPGLPFSTSSRVAGGFLKALPAQSALAPESRQQREIMRLKAIRLPDGVSLEHFYDNASRPAATLYPDGVRVRYEYDEASRLKNIYLDAFKKISYAYCEGGQLESATFTGNPPFIYRYDNYGSPVRRIYPDHKSIGYVYDRNGRPVEISCDGHKFAYEWDAAGVMRRVSLKTGDRVRDFSINCGKLDADIESYRPAAGQPLLISVLGIWSYSPGGGPAEMVLPDGERLCLRRSADAGQSVLWDSAGQTEYRCDKAGILASVLYPDGTRSVFRRVPGTRDVYCVSAACTSLYQYDKNGRLCRIRSDNGRYTVFEYRGNSLVKLSTSMGWMEVRYDNEGRLCLVRFSGGASNKLSYAINGFPVSASLQRTAPDALAAVLNFLNSFWQWAALRFTLRLEDPILREV